MEIKKQLKKGDVETRYLIRVNTFIVAGDREMLLIKTNEVETDSATMVEIPNKKFLPEDAHYAQTFEFIKEKKYTYNGSYLESFPTGI